MAWAHVPRQLGSIKAVLIAGSSAYALLIAFVVARERLGVAALLVAIPAVLLLLVHAERASLIAIALILLVPAWTTIGVSHVDIALVTSLLAAATIVSARHYSPRLSDLALAVFVFSAGLSWLLQYPDANAGRIVITELTPIGFYIGARFIPRKYLTSAVTTLVVAGTFGALTVIYEWAHGSAVFSLASATNYIWKATDSSIFRPGGIFLGPPDASAVLCFVILFALASLGRFRGLKRAAVIASIAVSTTALVLTFTRAAFIALAAGVVVFLWLRRSQLLRPLQLTWMAAALSTVYLALAPALLKSATFQQGVVRPGTLSSREGYWQIALPIVTTNARTFVFGVGTGALGAPQKAPGVSVAAQLAERPQVITNSLHSQYVTSLVEQGVVGLAAVVFLLCAGLLPAARMARRTGQAIPAAIAASIVAMAVVMVVDSAFYNPASFALLMFCIGLSTRLPELDKATA